MGMRSVKVGWLFGERDSGVRPARLGDGWFLVSIRVLLWWVRKLKVLLNPRAGVYGPPPSPSFTAERGAQSAAWFPSQLC